MPDAGRSALADFIAKEFGGVAEVLATAVQMNTTVINIVGNDPDALGLTIINLGTGNVYVAPTNLVSTTNGIVLTPTGGSVSLTVRDDLTLPGYDWWGIAPSGANQLFVLRARRLRPSP